MLRKPTKEQIDILEAKERIVVVRACPGSGKTSVFAEKVRLQSKDWKETRKGIAALSFTNAARHEIFRRVGGSLLPPHFISTLDSFMLRYVVLPFGHIIGLPKEGARLVPAPLDQNLRYPEFHFDRGPTDKIPIYSVRIVGGTTASPILVFRHPIKRTTVQLSTELAAKAMKMKWDQWKKHGRITHTDSHYLAALLLCDHKDLLTGLLAKRFPIILVDEVQDTMWFLSRALLSLLSNSAISGMVVGDPDQAIYEFGGASADIFSELEQLEGAKSYPMSVSQRCSPKICKVITALSESSSVIASASSETGGATVIVVHKLKDDQIDGSVISKIIQMSNLSTDTVVVTRNTRICQRLNVRTNLPSYEGKSVIGRSVDFALTALRRGDNTRATNIIAREIWKLLTDSEHLPNTRELEQQGIERRTWRKLIYRVLTEAEKYIHGETWNDWITRLKSVFEAVLSSLGKDIKLGKLFMQDSKSGSTLRLTVASVPPDESGINVHTIHQVKGAEFSNIVVFLNKPHQTYSPCISTQWWHTSNSEERRIGFVAASRPSKGLVICLHQDTFKALKIQQPDFLKLFETVVELS